MRVLTVNAGSTSIKVVEVVGDETTASSPDSLDDALAGALTVVGTSARTGKQRRPHWRLDAFGPVRARRARGRSPSCSAARRTA